MAKRPTVDAKTAARLMSISAECVLILAEGKAPEIVIGRCTQILTIVRRIFEATRFEREGAGDDAT